ncbi:hypothetical protein LOTGIDRAFT_151894 [Lottia gigantea]|uniref:RING-type domain-containing protein n=1 Tax=Lottia gigantea TaxID=225164 RepID=V4BGR9_LOTGI|nr:hypothetical protein LOTGIDRAFT_151894 [Lottia gigantea]ESP05097.1 hypothetical protein LOTGIDRAFT_151894 [Lottia gigantea]
MATSSVGNLPECSVCCESFEIAPKFLPCGHTFCLPCIKRCIADKRETFPCPFCRSNVKIPEGGAKNFPDNYIVQTSKHTTKTPQPKCPNHSQKEVDLYCSNCNVGLCLKCIFIQHKDHETLDIESDDTRNKAIEKLQRSQRTIQNRIKHLVKTRSTLLESLEQLESLCEESCVKVTEKTEQIVSNLRRSCEQIITDIGKNLEENRSKVEDREKKLTREITLLEREMESNISPSTKTTLNILQTLPRLIKIEKQSESRKCYNLCVQYSQWVGKEFSFDIDQLGSVISKPFYIPGSYQFIFNVSDIGKGGTIYYSKNKFRCNNLVWSCGVDRDSDDGIYIGVQLLSTDNPKLNYCIIDYQVSILNIDDDSKTITRTDSGWRFYRERYWGWIYPIAWSDLNSNGYLNSNGQFVVQCNITQIIEISWGAAVAQ